MTVATWQQPNNTTQTGTQYLANIDGGFSVHQALAGQFAPHAAATPNMTVVADAGNIMDAGSMVANAQQATTTITAPVGNPRIDRVVADQRTGIISVVTGTPAGSPAVPAIPSGKFPIAQVLLQTTSTAITNSMITDERVLQTTSDAYMDATFAPLASPALTGTPTAPTATAGTSNTQLATTAFVLSNGMPSGAIIDFAGTAAPAGFLACPVAAGGAQLVSRTTYAALFAAIGTTWGAGDGSTTFGIPWFPADYAAVQANVNVATQTVGAVIAHTHRPVYGGAPSTTTQVYNNLTNTGLGAGASGMASAVLTIESTGGAANLAAGVRVMKCVKI